jgi:hypothetical protein
MKNKRIKEDRTSMRAWAFDWRRLRHSRPRDAQICLNTAKAFRDASHGKGSLYVDY